ncbi:kinase-like protein [Serendipita vermifera]|nr:kinase-like protein [Serendipita vermifera]
MSKLRILTSENIDQINEEIPELSGQVKLLGPKAEFQGNYSDVYRGTFNGQVVAVKVLKALGRGRERNLTSIKRRVKRERITWALLDHPHILPLLGYAEKDPQFGELGALISPWCTKGDSGRWLQEVGLHLSMNQRINLWRDVASAIDYLHTHDPVLVHGDLKPRNILIDENFNVKICDFGLIGIVTGEECLGLTTTSEHAGTDRYVAPEFVLSNEPIMPTPQSDVYALGCIGLKFVFLKDPYENRPNNRFGQIFHDIRDGKPPATKPQNVVNDEDVLWYLLESCWEQKPERRPTAGVVFSLLQSISLTKLVPTQCRDHNAHSEPDRCKLITITLETRHLPMRPCSCGRSEDSLQNSRASTSEHSRPVAPLVPGSPFSPSNPPQDFDKIGSLDSIDAEPHCNEARPSSRTRLEVDAQTPEPSFTLVSLPSLFNGATEPRETELYEADIVVGSWPGHSMAKNSDIFTHLGS